MFFMKLSLLTLLIVASGWLINAENEITCYGNMQHLYCESGLIRVRSAIYGRTDGTTCSAGRPSSQLQNTNCAISIPQISQRCDGLSVCDFMTDAIGSPDPCVGTYKYYNTTYDCVHGYSSVTCGNGYSTLDCGSNLIQIINANYGRTNRTTCSASVPSAWTANTNCFAPNTSTTVAAWCNGKSKCTVQASSLLGDPCVGTYKYLNVFHFCYLPRTTVTCEGGIAALICGAGYVYILSANYGRTDSTTCSLGRPISQITNTNCYAISTLSIVKSICDYMHSCIVPATYTIFTDPCVYTYKYLKIEYTCMF